MEIKEIELLEKINPDKLRQILLDKAFYEGYCFIADLERHNQKDVAKELRKIMSKMKTEVGQLIVMIIGLEKK